MVLSLRIGIPVILFFTQNIPFGIWPLCQKEMASSIRLPHSK